MVAHASGTRSTCSRARDGHSVWTSVSYDHHLAHGPTFRRGHASSSLTANPSVKYTSKYAAMTPPVIDCQLSLMNSICRTSYSCICGAA